MVHGSHWPAGNPDSAHSFPIGSRSPQLVHTLPLLAGEWRRSRCASAARGAPAVREQEDRRQTSVLLSPATQLSALDVSTSGPPSPVSFTWIHFLMFSHTAPYPEIMGHPAPTWVLAKVVYLGTALIATLASACPRNCSCTEHNGLRVQCISLDLDAIPGNLPPNTVALLLASNRISQLPRQALLDLTRLRELNLSHNTIETLDAGAFLGLSDELRLLDLSHNHIRSLPRDAFPRLSARVRLTHNPWHCDCSLQEALRELRLDPDTISELRCHTAARDDLAGRPIIQILDSGVNFCNFHPKTMDVVMLVTMFSWFTVVVAYVVCYVRRNRDDNRRHLQYLKSLPSSSSFSRDFECVNVAP
ncbi:leucine-rich repeat-containing protein 3-like [Arapaima gigas]